MLLSLKDISKRFEDGNKVVQALNSVSLTIPEKQITAVIGKSGCGKSTLLNILGGLSSPTSGYYYFEGKEVNFNKRKELYKFRSENIGVVVQNVALVGNMTAYQNIELPIRGYRNRKSKYASIVELAKQLEIYDLLDNFPHQMSGGERQRVAIARALICNPKLILADEPTGSLDQEGARNVLKILRELGTTVILATHDKEIARSCNNIIEISYGEIVSFTKGCMERFK